MQVTNDVNKLTYILLKNKYTESNMPQNYGFFFTILLQNISHDYQTT